MRIYIRRIAFLLLAIGLLATVKPTLAASELEISKSVDNVELSADSSDNVVKYTIRVRNKSRCDLGADVMMVFDRSASMDDDGLEPPQPISSAKSASIQFADSLSAKDQLGLVSYSTTARLDATLSANKAPTKNAINSYAASGYTNIGDAIRLANDELNSPRHNPDHPKYIIMFTDGVANRPEEATAKQYALAQANNAKSSGVTLITIGLGQNFEANLLQNMASPGQYYYSPTAEQMSAIYQKIARTIRGVSPNTKITDDLSASLNVMSFLDASRGGKLSGNTLTWELGDLDCGEEREVSFRMQLKCVDTNGTIPNSATISNSTGGSAKSNTTEVKYVSPKLNLSYTDNTQIARPGEVLTYVATAHNVGSGVATNYQICLSIPTSTTVVQTTGVKNGEQICWGSQNLNPGEKANYTLQVKLNDNFAEGYSSINSTATISNESCGTTSATDITQVFVAPKPQPDYRVFATCVELSSDKQSYTAHFGFENKLASPQQLDQSSLTPAGSGNPPILLSTGIVDRAFTASARTDEPISWYTKADKIERTAVATSKFTPCNGNTVPDPTIDPVPTPNPGDVIGTPVVRSRKKQPAINKQPNVSISQISYQCSTRRVKVANCSAIDDSAIETMQYSLDNGASWHPVTNVKGLGDSNASCTIETRPLHDGSYDLIVRARDNSGVWGSTAATKVDVNCEGVVIGANHPAVRGLSSLVTDKNGTLVATSNEPLALSIEIAGGPAAAKVVISETKEEFALNYKRELNLWQGTINTSKIGNFQLEVIATEADNKVYSRKINRLQVVADKGLAQTDATLAVFTRTNSDSPWREWNGQGFNQLQSLPARDSNNMVFVTPGEYYLTVTKEGFLPANSNIVKVTSSSYLQVSGELLANNLLNRIVNIWHEVQLEVIDNNYLNPTSELVGKDAPAIKLVNDKEELDNKYFLGKRTVLVVWNQWSPIGVEQMLELSAVAKSNPGINFMVVNSLINPDESKNYLERGSYNLNFYRTDNSYYETWQANTLPISYFIDENGVIKSVTNMVMKSSGYRDALNVFNTTDKEINY